MMQGGFKANALPTTASANVNVRCVKLNAGLLLNLMVVVALSSV